MSTFRWSAAFFAVLALTTLGPDRSITAQSQPRLFEAGRPGAQPTKRPVRPHQARKAKLRLQSLDAPAFTLNLFDNAETVARQTGIERHGVDSVVWHGRTDDGGFVTFAIVEGVATGTVFLDGRSFEILPDPDGEHTIEELNAAAFPAEDEPLENPDLEGDIAADVSGSGMTSAGATTAADGVTEIAVMVLWTPAARTAAGSQAAIQSLILSAVANANLAYTNSLVNARLKLVHSAEVAYTENSLSGDLSSLQSTMDGKMDGIHALRNQYGADVVSLIVNGYAATGSCGVGYLMSSPSSMFAVSAFNVVDRACAAGNLSLAHEVGHNQGLQHDPGSAGGAASYPYAYGYQDPGNLFRTLMSYGGATRVPYFSSPRVFYGGRVMGTSSQDNARALNNNAALVAAFRGGTTTTPTCSYSVSPSSLSFQSGATSATVNVTTTAGCGWTSSSGSAWASVSGSGSGSGTARVSVVSNGGASRSASVTVAGRTVSVSQAGPAACTYTVTPTALTFPSAGGSVTVSVNTAPGCGWISPSTSASWASVVGTGTGPGTARISIAANAGASRSATVRVAANTITVTQSASACTYTVTPTSLAFTSASGSATVTVSTTAGCGWTSSGSSSWASVSGSGSGSGTARVSVVTNGGASRSGTVTVAGRTVSVSQAGPTACTYTVTPTALSFPSAGGSATVTVNTAAGCGWISPSTSASWASVVGSGAGKGTARISVAPNGGGTRTATVRVAANTVTVTQAAK